MTKVLIAFALLAIVPATGDAQSRQPPPWTGVRSQVSDYGSRLGALGVTGIMLVARRDSVATAPMGLARDALPVTDSTVFSVGSLSKQFTATAIAVLLNEGSVSPATTLAEIFGDIPTDKQLITVSQLLSHTAGLPRDVRGARAAAPDSVLRLLLTAELRSNPGESYAYSNAGYQLLAAVIEQVANVPFKEFVRRLFDRAGLRETGFYDDMWQSASVARPHSEMAEMEDFRAWEHGWSRYGSGGVVSSARDMARWLRALSSGRILSRNWLDSMLTPQSETGYGWGWEIERGDPELLVWHGGDVVGYHSILWWYPQRGETAVVLLSHDLYDESGFGLGVHKHRVAADLRRILNGDAITWPPPAVRRVTGGADTVGLDDGSRLVLFETSRGLSVGSDGQGAVDLLAGLDSLQAQRARDSGSRSLELFGALAAADTAAVRELVHPEDVGFVTRFILPDIGSMIESHGRLRSVALRGALPLPWDGNMIRTHLWLEFPDTEFDLQMTWNEGRFYETVTETGRPYPLILPVGELDSDLWASYDPVTGVTTLLSVRGDSISVQR